MGEKFPAGDFFSILLKQKGRRVTPPPFFHLKPFKLSVIPSPDPRNGGG
jgi:hypothetical protein